MARRLMLVVLTALLGLSAIAMAQARREMTLQEYEAQLQECQERKREADAAREAIEQQVEQKAAEAAVIDSQVLAINHQIMEMLGSDSAAAGEYRNALNGLEQQLKSLRQLPPGQIVDAREAGELDRIEEQLRELKTNLLAALPESQAKIQAIERLLAELRGVQRPIPPVRTDIYTVVRGDHLWKIARRPSMYSDPFAWVRLYSANQDMIEDPNLIYPDWVINVPRNQAPGTYWVQQGDNLSDIAGSQLGDPSMWAGVYRENKDLIERLGGDEVTIYPHMILNVPQQ
jgi:nucleoid-associated protein YgaU